MSNVIEEANWKFHWRLTESAGIMVYLADYKGRRVLWEGSMPYVTVDHQHQSLEVEANAIETHGPWWVPLGTRTLQGPVRMQSFRGGVELSAAFAAGPYHYTQLWRFHDGEWAPYSPRSAAGVQTFPAAYVGEEPLDGDDVTLWYVAHVHFDQSFPYTAGPWIKVAGLG